MLREKMKVLISCVVLILVGAAYGGQKCSGNPKMYNGKKCASTTRYVDYHKGACGCGPDNGDSQVAWNHDHFVVAANQLTFDEGGKGWCGQTCGRCIRLTTTGGYVDGQGGPTSAGQSHVFMITNLCPNEYPNLSWCSQTHGHKANQYGYGYHFDLENGAGQIAGIGWNNPEVTWEWTSCTGGGKSVSSQTYHSDCFCGKHGKRSADNGTDY